MTNPEARASAGALLDANLFDIVGPIHLNYSSSSIAGVPLVSYKDAELELSFRGEDIIRVETVFGELVTFTLEHVPDAYIRTFTLIVPRTALTLGGETDFDTLGIETTDRSGAFVAPPGPLGVLQVYRVHQLHGNAQHVNF